MAAHPPGFVEYVDAMGPRGSYGKWLRDRKATTRVGTTAFMHAGLSAASSESLDDVNRAVARSLAAWDQATETLVRERLASPVSHAEGNRRASLPPTSNGSPRRSRAAGRSTTACRAATWTSCAACSTSGTSPLLAAEGPMWFRGLSRNPPEETSAEVTALLQRLDVTRLVIAHTPQLPGRIAPHFDDRVFVIDTGMLSQLLQGWQGVRAGDRRRNAVTAIYEDGQEVLAGK